jgi:hypothetical protein
MLVTFAFGASFFKIVSASFLSSVWHSVQALSPFFVGKAWAPKGDNHAGDH